MSSLRERVEGLVAGWRKATKAISAEGHERPLEWEGKEILRLCADELAAALAAEGQGYDSLKELMWLHDETAKILLLLQMTKFTQPEALEEIKRAHRESITRFMNREKLAAAAPSLHKEGPECGCDENRCYGPITGYSCRAGNSATEPYSTSGECTFDPELPSEPAALHKEGAGDDAELIEAKARLREAARIAEKLRKVARQYGAGGHTHREKMLNALAEEIFPRISDLSDEQIIQARIAEPHLEADLRANKLHSFDEVFEATGTESAPLPLQRTLPDEQFKGAVVEPIEGAQSDERWAYSLLNELGIKDYTQRQFAVCLSFAEAMRASPAGRAEPK